MEYWTDVKNKINNTLKEVQKNPILDAFAVSALESVPVVGVLLLKIYENSTDSPKDKTAQILELLQNMSGMSEMKLEKVCREMEKNREEVLTNRSYLKTLVNDTTKIIEELEEVHKGQRTFFKKNDKKQDLILEKLNKLDQIIEEQKKSYAQKDVGSQVDPDKTIEIPEVFLREREQDAREINS